MNTNNQVWNGQPFQNQNQQQFQRFSPDNRVNYTNTNLNKRQYNEDLYKIAGFSFPNNNLLLIALMKRISKNSEKNDKENYIAFVTTVLGVGNGNNRTYDFNQKIVQKFSLRELKSLVFAIKQLAKNDISILPYSKFTNSGEGSKTLYLKFHSRNQQNFNNNNNNNAQDAIILGASWNQLKINLNFNKYDAYGVADAIEQLYNLGMKLELNEQINRNYSHLDLNYSQSNINVIPTNSNVNNVPFPSVNTNLVKQDPNYTQSVNSQFQLSQNQTSPLINNQNIQPIDSKNTGSVLANFQKMVFS